MSCGDWLIQSGECARRKEREVELLEDVVILKALLVCSTGVWVGEDEGEDCPSHPTL